MWPWVGHLVTHVGPSPHPKDLKDQCDIRGNTYLVIVSGYWHRALKNPWNFLSDKE